MSTPTQGSPTPDRILQFVWGYAPPIIISSATRHKLFDALEGGSQTAEQVAARTGTSPRSVRRVLNALVGLQLLNKVNSDQYSLTPDSAAFLVSTKPGYLGGMLQHVGHDLIPRWMNLPETVKTGKPARSVNEQEGAEFFEQLVVGLFPMNFMAARALGQHLNVANTTNLKILDVAAGSGVWGLGVAEQAPNSTVTAADWANVLEVTKRFASQHKMADRFSYIAGDLRTVDFGSGYNLAILGHILHSEGEPAARDLLKKMYRALAPGGRIAIAEFLVNPERTGPPMPLFFAVNMLVNTDMGDTFSFPEISSWLTDAGFKNARAFEPGGPATVIVADKA
jgi:ubiquinone/menaquinone biosynthesis C-methylase UbiE